LKAVAHVVDRIRATGLDQRLLDDGEATLEQAEQRVVDEEGLGLRGSLAVVLLVEPHERVGDVGEDVASCGAGFPRAHFGAFADALRQAPDVRSSARPMSALVATVPNLGPPWTRTSRTWV